MHTGSVNRDGRSGRSFWFRKRKVVGKPDARNADGSRADAFSPDQMSDVGQMTWRDEAAPWLQQLETDKAPVRDPDSIGVLVSGPASTEERAPCLANVTVLQRQASAQVNVEHPHGRELSCPASSLDETRRRDARRRGAEPLQGRTTLVRGVHLAIAAAAVGCETDAR